MTTHIAAVQDRTARKAGGGRGLRVALWTAQGLLAVLFGMAGFMKATAPLAVLAAKMPWTTAAPAALVRFIGTAEILGALGLLLPSLTRIRPALTPVAAAGLATIMTLAIAFHLTRGETGVIGFNLALGALAVFVAWGRSRRARIAARA